MAVVVTCASFVGLHAADAHTLNAAGRARLVPASTTPLEAARSLPPVTHWRGQSSEHALLSEAVFEYSKWLGFPRRVGVACWSEGDWRSVAGSGEHHILLGFWTPAQPRRLHLSPRVCRSLQALMSSRPRYADATSANALDTVAHEMLHAMGYRNEAQTECYAMQTADVVGHHLGVPRAYLKGLSRLFLVANSRRSSEYQDPIRCSEGGVWDLDPAHASAPWHP